MRELFRNLSLILEAKNRRQVTVILVFMVLLGGIEVLGIGSILPFLAVVSDPGLIHSNRVLSRIYQTLSLQSERELVFLLGAGCFVLVTAGNLLNAYSGWLLSRFVTATGNRISTLLIGDHLRRPYATRVDRHTSDVVTGLFVDVRKLTQGVLMPGLNVTSRMVVVIAVFALLIAVDPVIALTATAVLGVVYVALYRTLRHKIFETGRRAEQGDATRMRVALEALSAIKEVKVFGIDQYFVRRFSAVSTVVGRAETNFHLMSHTPRYAIEAIAFGGVVAVALYLTRDPRGMVKALPVIALFTFAAYRLLPSVQQIFSGVATVRFHAPALAAVAAEMVKVRGRRSDDKMHVPQPLDSAWSAINVIGASMAYPGRPSPVLDRVEISITRNQKVGIVGATGSGKSTLIDLIVGLTDPTSGEVRVGDQTLPLVREEWFREIGYVPQNTVLLDATIKENIAFGVEVASIDMDAVVSAARLAQIDRFIEDELPAKYDTAIGEGGGRMSGGQRQRLALARALYRKPKVIVLDEATSAVDADTERQIVDAVQSLSWEATVIAVTHGVSALRNFDKLIVLEGGRKVAEGKFEELLETSEQFRAVAG